MRISALALAATALLSQAARALPPGSTPREIELGKEASRDIEKTVRFVDDAKQLEKLGAMLKEIAAVTERPAIEYRAHIVESPLPNAFVLPGGWVYVTTGLLEQVESDDELAGVLAHEIAHNVNQHAIERMRDAPKGLGLLQLATIAALILGRSPEAAILANTAANTITAMVLQGGSIAAEVEADAHGIDYLTRTHYNPVGFLTFMERLASSSGKFIEQELGIYRTHPLTRDRVRAAEDRLRDHKVPLLRRLVTKPTLPASRFLVHENQQVTEVAFRSERLFLLARHDSARAAVAVAAVRWALDHELDETRIKISPAEKGVLLAPNGGPTLLLSAEDGRVNAMGEVVLAEALRRRLAEIVQSEQTRYRANAQMY